MPLIVPRRLHSCFWAKLATITCRSPLLSSIALFQTLTLHCHQLLTRSEAKHSHLKLGCPALLDQAVMVT
ncbi:hypothetical protein LINGRAHAP2_LOCUS7996 [Linum grandiflorum]